MAAKKKRKKLKARKGRSKKKTVKRKTKAQKKVQKKSKKAAKKSGVSEKQLIGVVTHYFPHVRAAVVKLKKPLSVGDMILIKGATTNFEQRVESMQIDHVPIQTAKKGDEIGLQVKDRVREHDSVLLPD